jgi:1-acyl-sn-glycerol-3-phosphate acyltransferase
VGVHVVIYAVRYLLIALYTVFWGIVACLVGPFDRRGRIFCWIGRRWVSWIFATCGIRVEVEGLENVDTRRPHVFMSNHQSAVDIGALVKTIPVDPHFVAKRELAWIPFFGWALALSVGIMVDRGNRARAVASLRRAARKVREGTNVIIFPEGTRSPTGELAPFKSGGFHLALQAQVPIVPVTVSGSQRITPKRSLRVESGTVKIVYGKPIPTEGLGVDEREELKERVRSAIVQGYDPTYQELLAPRQDGGVGPGGSAPSRAA